MRLSRKLSALVKRYGYVLTEGIDEAVNDFVATVLDHNPDKTEGPAVVEDQSESVETLAQMRPITCPHCGETVDVEVDLSGGDQDDIQDCAVCCSPIHIVYTVRNGALASFSSEPS